MPLFRTQSAAKQTSLAPHDSKARLQNGHDSQGFMAKPCTPHLIAQRLQLFKPQTGNVGDRGALPSRSLGGQRGPFSHVREWPPLTPKRTRGEGPSIPDIAGLRLEELQTLRNQVRCTWLRHESLRIVTVLQPRLTIVRRE